MLQDQKSSGSSATTKSLIAVNGLQYSLPPSLSVTVARSHKKFYANRDSYTPTQTMTCVLSSGSDYVDGTNSYLKFTVTAVYGAGTTVVTHFGDHGSVLNLFKSVRLTHASGTEIERIERFNLYKYITNRYTKTSEWTASTGQVMGYGGSAVHDFKAAASNAIEFCVPLSELSDLFGQRQLIPSFLISGMRLEIELENGELAMEQDGTALTLSYTITNPEVFLDTHTLSDAIVRNLARISSNDGLEFTWESASNTSISPGTTQRNTIEASQALSRANKVMMISRTDNALDISATTAAATENSFESEAYPITEWQFALGAQYFPQAAVLSAKSAYIHAVRDAKNNSVTPTLFELDSSLMVQSLERSQILQGSGMSISSNRGLIANVLFNTSVARTIDLFVTYQKLASVFLDNVVIRQ